MGRFCAVRSGALGYIVPPGGMQIKCWHTRNWGRSVGGPAIVGREVHALRTSRPERPAWLRWRRRATHAGTEVRVRKLLAALLAISMAALAAPLAGQIQEKAAPEDVQDALSTELRVAMTHARRVENADATEKENAAREIGVLADRLDAVDAAVEAVAKAAGSDYGAQVDAIRKYAAEARKHVEQLKGMADRPVSAAAKAQAAGVREQLDLADTAQQKLIKAMAAPKPAPAKPAAPPA